MLTPVAVFDPIEIDGSTVERASLHNVSVMRQTLGECAYVGEPLEVYKANMIIPQIINAEPKYNYGEVIAAGGVSANDVPEVCPICGGSVSYRDNDGVITLVCDNPYCEGKLINRLDHFFGKKGLDIKGISKATFEKLIDWGWVTSIEDVFYLSINKNEWIKKDGFGVASVTKILQSIENGKNVTLESFLSAIGIPLIGKTYAKELVKHFKSYSDFRDAVMDDTYHFFTLNNFGEEMDFNLKNFNYEEFDRISKLLTFKETIVNNSEQKLNNMTFCITGKLKVYKNRTELSDKIKSLGGKVVDKVTSKTVALINNDVNSNSSKNKTAKDLNIPIVSEEDFIRQYIEK